MEVNLHQFAREWIGVEGLLLSGEVEETDKSEFTFCCSFEAGLMQ